MFGLYLAYSACVISHIVHMLLAIVIALNILHVNMADGRIDEEGDAEDEREKGEEVEDEREEGEEAEEDEVPSPVQRKKRKLTMPYSLPQGP